MFSDVKTFKTPRAVRLVIGMAENKWGLLFSYHVHYETIWTVHDSLNEIHDLVDFNVTARGLLRSIAEFGL